MLRLALLLALANIITANVNINFANLLSGVSQPTSTCPACPTCAASNPSIADQPYLSLRLALDAGAVRVASKGLWNRFWVTENSDWPGIAFDASCSPLPSRFPFPPKTGAFSALLARGLVVAFNQQNFANIDGRKNPPTGNLPDYITAVINELKAEYGPFNFIWRGYAPGQSKILGMLRGEFDFDVSSVLGYSNASNPVAENRIYTKIAAGCPAYLEPGYFATLAGSKYKDLTSLAAGGSKVRALVWPPNDALFPSLLPQAVAANPPNFDYSDFSNWLKVLVDGTVDILWGANIVAADVVGTPYRLEQFAYFPRGDWTRRDWITPIDK